MEITDRQIIVAGRVTKHDKGDLGKVKVEIDYRSDLAYLGVHYLQLPREQARQWEVGDEVTAVITRR